MTTAAIIEAAITKTTRQELLPSLKPTLEDLCKVAQVQVDAMSFSELNDFIKNGVTCIYSNLINMKEARIRLRPALIRVHDMCAGQGKRNDLAGGVTWKTFCANMSHLGLGCKRTLDALIAEAGLENPNNQPKLFKGDQVILSASTCSVDGKDRHVSRLAEVTLVHEKTNPTDDIKVDVKYESPTGEKTETVRVTEVEKVKPVRLPALNSGDLVILLDIEGGAEFRLDDKKLTRTDTPSPKQLKAAEKAKREADSKANGQAHKDRIVEAVAAVKGGMGYGAAATQFKVGRKEILANLPKTKPAKVAKKKDADAKPRTSRKAKDIAIELVARKLGDKYFLFAKNEVEFSSRTTKSSQFDTLDEAEAVAAKLNVKYGFVTPMDALIDNAKETGSITMNEYYEAFV